MNKKIDYIIKTSSANNKDKLFAEAIKWAFEKKLVSNQDKVIKALNVREVEGTTNFGQGFAIPHCRSSAIKNASLIFVNFKKGEIEFDSNPKITFAVFILLPEKLSILQTKILGVLVQALLDDKNKKMVSVLNKEKIINLINKIEKSLPSENPSKKTNVSKKESSLESKPDSKIKHQYKIIAATSCPTGIAHTYMAGKSLANAATAMNYQFKCEYHSAMGLENELTSNEIHDADIVILAIGKAIDESRFFGKRIFYCSPGKAIKDPKLMIQRSIKESTYIGKEVENTIKEKSTTNKSSENKKFHEFKHKKLAKHGKKIASLSFGGLLNGISWMIPVVVLGGLILSIAIGIGLPVTKVKSAADLPPGSIFYALNIIGGQALGLMIAVLGGFIAVGISGKAAFAPAFVLSYCFNFSGVGNSSPLIFNYSHLEFGVVGGQLGFLGAIVIGIICGFIVKWIKIIKFPFWIKPIVPIILIPVLVTLFVFVIVSFVLGLPVFYALTGINSGLHYLLSNSAYAILLSAVLGFLIAIDMGGPLNKTAFILGASLLTSGNPDDALNGALIMGANGAAIAIPPIGMSLAAFIGRPLKIMDDGDVKLASGSILLGFMGITEGAIPFAVKYPKSAFASNILGGIIGAGIAGGLGVTNVVAQGGIIVYLVGAVGKSNSIRSTVDYLYGLYYVMSIVIGSIMCAISMLLLTKIFYTGKNKTSHKTIDLFATN